MGWSKTSIMYLTIDISMLVVSLYVLIRFFANFFRKQSYLVNQVCRALAIISSIGSFVIHYYTSVYREYYPQGITQMWKLYTLAFITSETCSLGIYFMCVSFLTFIRNSFGTKNILTKYPFCLNFPFILAITILLIIEYFWRQHLSFSNYLFWFWQLIAFDVPSIWYLSYMYKHDFDNTNKKGLIVLISFCCVSCINVLIDSIASTIYDSIQTKITNLVLSRKPIPDSLMTGYYATVGLTAITNAYSCLFIGIVVDFFDSFIEKQVQLHNGLAENDCDILGDAHV